MTSIIWNIYFVRFEKWIVKAFILSLYIFDYNIFFTLQYDSQHFKDKIFLLIHTNLSPILHDIPRPKRSTLISRKIYQRFVDGNAWTSSLWYIWMKLLRKLFLRDKFNLHWTRVVYSFFYLLCVNISECFCIMSRDLMSLIG